MLEALTFAAVLSTLNHKFGKHDTLTSNVPIV